MANNTTKPTTTINPTTTTAINTTATTPSLTTTRLTSTSVPSTTVSQTTTETLLTTSIDNTTTANSQTNGDSHDDMPMLGILGIVAGVCLIMFCIFLVLFFLYRKRRKPPRPFPIPTLPSASQLDKPIFKPQAYDNNAPTTHDESSEQITSVDDHSHHLYSNTDVLGNPMERTDPSTGDDGYLKKTRAGVDYIGEGKKKGRKKKLKDKFKTKNNNGKHKVQKANTENKTHCVNEENVNEHTSETDHQYVNRVNSDIEYAQGRAADTVQKGYSSVNELHTNNTFYENLTGIELRDAKHVKGDGIDVGEENYYNVDHKDDGPSEIYENTG